MSLLKRRFLFEADDDNTDAPDQSSPENEVKSTSDDNTDNDETADTNDENEETSSENTDDQSEEESTESDEQTEESEEENYDIDSEPEETPNENTDENTDDDDGSEYDTNTDDNEQSTDSEEKELDRELFDSLTEDEKKRKVETLKKLYMDLYSKCDALVNRFNQMTSDDDNFFPVIKRILSTLYDLKKYISYYLLNVYDNKSYIENDITFNRYLSVLNGIKLVVKELEKSKEDGK